MSSDISTQISDVQVVSLLQTLRQRFLQHMHRHRGIGWEEVAERLQAHPTKLWSLQEMELTGGEPDVVSRDSETDEFLYFDCAKETPKGRRSACYDREGWESRKEHRPPHNAIDMATNMGIELLTEDDYRMLQTVEPVDLKTSSWIKTPESIRSLGGALFCDRRYNHVFTYHNGAQSYYAVRGFRGKLRV